MRSAEELKVYAIGGRRVVFVRASQVEGLRGYLDSRGVLSEVGRPQGLGVDRLELDQHTDIREVQAVVDDWPRPPERAQGTVMQRPMTLQDREKELQSLFATPAGRAELQELAARYEFDGGRVRPEKTSVVTYILVHERGKGLIVG